MKWILSCCLIIILPANVLSQKRVRVFVFHSKTLPEWDESFCGLIKKEHYLSDSVYEYKKLKNNHDSSLAIVQYFDTAGNVIQRFEFESATHAISKVINYRYNNGVLTMVESLSHSGIIINDNNGNEREVHTFDTDSAGNVVTDKEYKYFGGTTRGYILTIKTREYDSKSHITKEYVLLPNRERYLYRIFEYLNGVLTEEKILDDKQQWMYSYIYEYDTYNKTKSIYLLNDSKNIKSVYTYDNQNRVVSKKFFNSDSNYWNNTIIDNQYGSNGLILSQTVKDYNIDKLFYRHFYSNTEP